MLKKLKGAWRVFMTPSCWMLNYPFDARWDTLLKGALIEHSFRPVYYFLSNEEDPHHVYLGPYKLWVTNHPYASFVPAKGPQVRASRITILEAHDKWVRDSLEAATRGAVVVRSIERGNILSKEISA
jgi:hypothetical protein